MPRFVGPFSVPDPDADAWDDMVRRNRLLQDETAEPRVVPPDPLNDPGMPAQDWYPLRASQLLTNDNVADASGGDELVGGDGDDHVQLQPSQGGSQFSNSLPRYGSAATSDLSGPAPDLSMFRKHPGLAESTIPVWGSAREAIADGFDGNYPGAFINTALAAADAFLPGEAIARGLAKAGVKAALKEGADMGWKNVRARMARAGYFGANEQGHHWAIPNRFNWVPDYIRNHPLNIKALPADVHKLIHFNDRINGVPKFNFLEGLIAGTPDWAKDVATWTTGQLSAKTVLASSRGEQPKQP